MKRRVRWHHEDNVFGSTRNAKEEICAALRKAVDEDRMTQAQVAVLLRASQANVSCR